MERNQRRTLIAEFGERNSDTGAIPAALSSETPVRQPFGTEVLVHDAEAINFERASNGLPLLLGHDHAQLIGRVDNVHIGPDRKLRGDIVFAKNEKAAEVAKDVEAGMYRDISIGYRIDDYQEDEDDLVRVTKWTPMEASVVSVPADSVVGFNRSNEDDTMSDDAKTGKPAEDAETTRPSAVAEMRLLKKEREAERKQGAIAESQRRAEIRSLFDRFESQYGAEMSDLRRQCEDNPLITPTAARDEIFELLAEGTAQQYRQDVTREQDPGSSFKGARPPRVQAGESDMEKFERGVSRALLIQTGSQFKPEEVQEAQQGEYLSMSVSEMARDYLRIKGERATGNREQVIGQALKYGRRDAVSHGTGDFASILENVANKSMLDGFMQAEETWNQWTQSKSIPDFKTASLLNLSLFNGLDLLPEGKQYEYGDMSDIKETIQLATYGKLFSISRQALANDDLSALGDVPRAMGMAANYQIGDIVYNVLTTGTTTTMLQDGVALFDAATHGNYVTSGAAPTVTTLDAARVAMATQTDPQGKTIGVRMGYLIVPIALQTTAETLIAATYDPAGTAGTLTPNPMQNVVQVVADHRLDTFNSSGWFVAARMNTVCVGFLNGQTQPFLESRDGWSIDGVELKVRIDAAATASDYRGLYYNDGVT